MADDARSPQKECSGLAQDLAADSTGERVHEHREEAGNLVALENSRAVPLKCVDQPRADRRIHDQVVLRGADDAVVE